MTIKEAETEIPDFESFKNIVCNIKTQINQCFKGCLLTLKRVIVLY